MPSISRHSKTIPHASNTSAPPVVLQADSPLIATLNIYDNVPSIVAGSGILDNAEEFKDVFLTEKQPFEFKKIVHIPLGYKFIVLNLASCTFSKQEEIIDLMQNLEPIKNRITEWHSPNQPLIDDFILEEIAFRFPHLKTVNVKGCPHVTGTGVKLLTESYKISVTAQITAPVYWTLLDLLPQSALAPEASNVNEPTDPLPITITLDDLIPKLALFYESACPHLNASITLACKNNSAIDKPSLLALIEKLSPFAEYVQNWRSPNIACIDDDIITALAKAFPHLQELNLENCSSITTICDQFLHIKTVDITGCYNFIPTELNTLRNKNITVTEPGFWTLASLLPESALSNETSDALPPLTPATVTIELDTLISKLALLQKAPLPASLNVNFALSCKNSHNFTKTKLLQLINFFASTSEPKDALSLFSRHVTTWISPDISSIDDEVIAVLAKAFPYLEEINVRNCAITGSLTFFKSLKKADITGCYEFNYDEFLTLKSQNIDITNPGFWTFADLLPKGAIPDQEATKNASSQPIPVTIMLENWVAKRRAFRATSLPSHLNVAITFSCGNSDALNNTALLELLHLLSFEKDGHPSSFAKYVRKWHSYNTLNVDDKVITTLVNAFSFLEEVSLEHCFAISGNALQYLSRAYLPNLQTLTLKNSLQREDASFTESFPDLQVLPKEDWQHIKTVTSYINTETIPLAPDIAHEALQRLRSDYRYVLNSLQPMDIFALTKAAFGREISQLQISKETLSRISNLPLQNEESQITAILENIFAKLATPPTNELLIQSVYRYILLDILELIHISADKNFANLETLHLQNCTLLTLELLASKCNHLQHLNFQQCYHLSDDILNEFISNNPGLKSLTISNCKRITTLPVDHGFSKLQSLHIEGCTSLTRKALKELGMTCTNLRQLTLKNCTILTKAKLARFIAHNPHLESLDISGSTKLITIAQNTTLTSLTSLNLQDCTALETTALELLATTCKNLRHVNASNCVNLDSRTFRALINNNPYLKSLDISGCMNIDQEAKIEALNVLKHLDSLISKVKEEGAEPTHKPHKRTSAALVKVAKHFKPSRPGKPKSSDSEQNISLKVFSTASNHNDTFYGTNSSPYPDLLELEESGVDIVFADPPTTGSVTASTISNGTAGTISSSIFSSLMSEENTVTASSLSDSNNNNDIALDIEVAEIASPPRAFVAESTKSLTPIEQLKKELGKQVKAREKRPPDGWTYLHEAIAKGNQHDVFVLINDLIKEERYNNSTYNMLYQPLTTDAQKITLLKVVLSHDPKQALPKNRDKITAEESKRINLIDQLIKEETYLESWLKREKISPTTTNRYELAAFIVNEACKHKSSSPKAQEKKEKIFALYAVIATALEQFEYPLEIPFAMLSQEFIALCINAAEEKLISKQPTKTRLHVNFTYKQLLSKEGFEKAVTACCAYIEKYKPEIKETDQKLSHWLSNPYASQETFSLEVLSDFIARQAAKNCFKKKFATEPSYHWYTIIASEIQSITSIITFTLKGKGYPDTLALSSLSSSFIEQCIYEIGLLLDVKSSFPPLSSHHKLVQNKKDPQSAITVLLKKLDLTQMVEDWFNEKESATSYAALAHTIVENTLALEGERPIYPAEERLTLEAILTSLLAEKGLPADMESGFIPSLFIPKYVEILKSLIDQSAFYHTLYDKNLREEAKSAIEKAIDTSIFYSINRYDLASYLLSTASKQNGQQLALVGSAKLTGPIYQGPLKLIALVEDVLEALGYETEIKLETVSADTLSKCINAVSTLLDTRNMAKINNLHEENYNNLKTQLLQKLQPIGAFTEKLLQEKGTEQLHLRSSTGSSSS